MIGGMTKTPTASVRFDRQQDFIGGAAIVAAHLRAAGAEVTFSTVLGDDALKDFVLEGLAELRRRAWSRSSIATRPTTQKNAFVCGDYRLLKVDTLDNRSISDTHRRDLGRADPQDAGAGRGVQRFPPRHLQPPHHSEPDRGHPAPAPSVSPTARWRAAGATSSTSRAST